MAHPKLKFKTLISFSTFLFFLFMLVSVLSYGVYGEDEEAAYMLKLLNALTPTPSNWSSNTPICQWSGVSCGNHSRVEEIDLSSKSLTGELPSGLNSLSKLTRLYLYNNSLSGPLPSLANLTFLQVVSLYNNNFSSIPDGCFQGLTSLQGLSMSNNVNLAQWTFPTDLNHSLQLKFIYLDATNLMGSLPNISHFFPSLQNLYLSHNNLTSIPDGYFQGLTNLRLLSLSDNTNLAPWTFPIHLTQSSNLEYLNLSVTNLVGPLPDISHSFPNLSYVDLSNNKLTSIPDGCFQVLTGLRQLNLSYNTNLAPWTFPNLTQSLKLHYLDLVATNIMGPLPDIFNSFPNLETIRLSNNSLTGVLPMSFAGSKVGTLWLNDQEGNGLSGTIEVLSSMSYLSQVWLQGNSFEGPIPDLSRCIDLEELLLGHNRLTGVIPLDSLQLDKLEKVSLDNNFLQGPVPDLTGFYFEYLNLGNTTNSFCRHDVGPCDQRVTTLLKIAEAFGYPLLLARSWRGNNPCHNWRYIVCDGGKIRTMNLTSQNLTGTISPAFGNLTDLQNLYLGGNNLSGSIPESLTNLTQLKVVDVSNNKLSGNIPRFSPKVMFTAIGNAFLEHSQANSTIPSPDSSHRPSPTASVTSHSPSWIAGASAAGVGAIVIFVVVIYNRNRYLSLVQKMIFKETFADHNVEDFIKSYSFLVPKRYTYSEVKRMTNSFHDKLGQGGYGTVYKASLSDGQQVAVKVLSESKRNGEEFINEVASISRTSHVNIVSLLGFCYEINKRALIYEFMPNGSLDEFIHKKGFPNPFCNLDWTTLYQITIGIARGLEYLHRGCSTRILHLDIKPQNILLDEDFCPKIADFGLAKICKKKESVVSILGTRGTPGYIAPEVFSRTYGRVSHKSDVYSYGMLILEVVGGRKNYDSGGSHTSEKYFPDWIYNDLEQGNILIRCSAETEEENDMIMKIILVSLWCIQPNPSERPSMSKVVEMLEGPLLSVSYPPKPVLYSPERSLLQFSDTSCNSIHETSSIIVEENDSIK